MDCTVSRLSKWQAHESINRSGIFALLNENLQNRTQIIGFHGAPCHFGLARTLVSIVNNTLPLRESTPTHLLNRKLQDKHFTRAKF